MVLLSSHLQSHAEAAAPEVNEAKRSDTRKLIELSGGGKNAKLAIETLVAAYKKQMPDVPATFWDDFIKECNTDELTDLLVPVYEKHLSHDDIKAAIVFYQSEAGKHFTAAQPLIFKDSFKIGQEWGKSLAQKVTEKLKTFKAKDAVKDAPKTEEGVKK
jgi:hypothetical protein